MSSSLLPIELLQRAATPYRRLGNFAWRFARGKLGADPVFAGLLHHGLIPSHARVLDIGCGRGLLASLLCQLDTPASERNTWPADWAPPPQAVQVRGIDLMTRDVACARRALAPLGKCAEFEQGDMCRTDFGRADVVVLLDVLHYVGYAAQAEVLRRVKVALMPAGTLLLRVGDAAAGLPFHISQWVDTLVCLARGLGLPRLYGRTLHEWHQLLAGLGFTVERLPMHHGTPFANMLLVARLNGAGTGMTPNTP